MPLTAAISMSSNLRPSCLGNRLKARLRKPDMSWSVVLKFHG